jgi:hypothetical protein
MGLYATLHAPLVCPFCSRGSLDRAQFHLGDVHDLPDYKLGQRIRYDSNRMLGPKVTSGIAVGYPEPCTACGKQALTSIVIEEGTLKASHFRSSFPYEHDTVLAGEERVGSDGVLRHGTWFLVHPAHRRETLPSVLSRQEETILSEPLLAHLMCAWSEGEVTLRATREAHGRCITEWSLDVREGSSLPHSLAARLNASPLASMHLGQERAALRITTLPDATRALATLQESHPTLAFTLVHSMALGILASDDWRHIERAL